MKLEKLSRICLRENQLMFRVARQLVGQRNGRIRRPAQINFAVSEVWSKMHLLIITRLSVGLVSYHRRKLPGHVILLGSFLLASVLSAQTPQRPAITGISHIAIFAHDYEKSRAFYGQFLGFQEPYSLKSPAGPRP